MSISEEHKCNDSEQTSDNSDNNLNNSSDSKSSSVSLRIFIFIICYILFVIIGFICALNDGEFLILYSFISLLSVFIYNFFCMQNICNYESRIKCLVNLEYTLCVFGMIQMLALFLSALLYLESSHLGGSSSNGFESWLVIPMFFWELLVIIIIIPANMITCIVHVDASSNIKRKLLTFESIPQNSKNSIIVLRTISKIIGVTLATVFIAAIVLPILAIFF